MCILEKIRDQPEHEWRKQHRKETHGLPITSWAEIVVLLLSRSFPRPIATISRSRDPGIKRRSPSSDLHGIFPPVLSKIPDSWKFPEQLRSMRSPAQKEKI